MTIGHFVGPTACEGYAVDETTDTGYHVHCPGCAESASLRERLAIAEAEGDELRGLLAGVTEACRCSKCEAVRAWLLAHPVGIPEGTPTAEPVTFAAVKISRCPNCNEFPEQWQSGGMPCTQCGVDLESNIRADADGAELWEFDFADQADYDKKHAPEGTPGEGTGRL